MTNLTIEQAIAALEAARSRYREPPADVPQGIEKAVYLEMMAAKARVSGLFQEERRAFPGMTVQSMPGLPDDVALIYDRNTMRDPTATAEEKIRACGLIRNIRP